MPRLALRRYFRHGLLPQLMVFEAAARRQSVTRAAEELHLAQPTVSTQLRKLSETLDSRLFEHQGRGLRLTPAGVELQAACKELLELLRRTEARLAALRHPHAAALRLAAAPGARHLAARLLAAFCLRYPSVQVSLQLTNRDELVGRVLAGEHDLCLLLASDGHAGLVMKPVATELLHLYATAGHAQARAVALPLEALAAETVVLGEPGSRTRDVLLTAWKAHGLLPVVRAELASNEAIAEAVAAGLGLGLLPEDVAHPLLRSGAIVALDVQGFPLRREWSLARAKCGPVPPVAELFLRETVESAEARRASRPFFQGERKPDQLGDVARP
jgi:DNA-binding transcriptional LysR family regulator